MSLLLDALKNAERAKARNSTEQAKPFESETTRVATDSEPESELADPTELLSKAVLELEVPKNQLIIDDVEDAGVSVEATGERPEGDGKSEVKLDQDLRLELATSPESESVEPDSQATDSSSAQPAINDPVVDQLEIDRKRETQEVKGELQFEVTADNPGHNTLTLEPENAAQARQILNAPSRRNKNRWLLGLGLAGVVSLFCVGGYFFYVTTTLPTSPNFTQLLDSNTGIEADGVIVGVARNAGSGSTKSALGMEAVKDSALLLAAKAKSIMPTGGVIAPLDASKKTTEVDIEDDVQILSQPIKIKKTRVPRSVNKQLKKAYAALQNKNLERAKAHYGNVLQVSRNNVDALLGMGAIASRQRLPSVAREYFNKALKYDASNIYAQSALSHLERENDPLESESRLQTLIVENRNSAHLHFNLANLYAAQSRWSDAESAYFNAYNLDKSKPDYAYNLAISLDHLGKKGIARRYYETALHLTKYSPAHFDVSAVRRRLAQIHRG